MPGSCCAKPITTIIKVGNLEAGLIGLNVAFRNVYIAGVADEDELKQELLAWIKDFGNYVTPSRENDYKEALLREYKKYYAAMEREARAREAEKHKPAEETTQEQKPKRRWFK